MKEMNIESNIFLKYKEYILKNSKYAPKIFPNVPQSLKDFPTVIVKEQNNIDDNRYKSTNRQEFVNSLTYQIEIYTKNMIIGGKQVNSKIIMDELKYLTMDFFNLLGFDRTLCEKAEYLDVTVDRLIILEKGLLTSWNKQLSF